MKFHHIGYIVNDIDKYESNLLFENKIIDMEDPVQKARLALYVNFSDSYVELIQPLSNESFTYNALAKFGNSYHHVCYSIDSNEEMQQLAHKNKLILIKDWMPAVLFDNKLVSFYYTRNKTIVEFLLNKV